MSENVKNIPADLDFAGAGEESLENDIKKAGETVRNRYIVRWPNLYVRTYTGNTYRLPLDLTAGYFDGRDEDLSPLDQIKKLLQRENASAVGKQIDDEPSIVLLGIADKYADVVQNVQLASLGKYDPSGVK